MHFNLKKQQMNALEIKIRRKELGLKQSELAEKLGVSIKTVSNYENGEVIPLSKKALLHEILSNNTIITGSNLNENEERNYTGFEEKINQIEERITEHKNICDLLNENSTEFQHQKKLIKLLQIQISIIKKAKIEKENDPIL